MPTFRKLQEDEVRRSKKSESVRAKTAQEYDTYLNDFSLNEYGEVTFDEAAGEKKLTLRNRLKAAAQRRGWDMEFLRTSGNAIRFHVVEAGTATSNGENGSSNGQEAESEELQELNQPEITKPQGRKRGKKAAAEQEQAVGEAPTEG